MAVLAGRCLLRAGSVGLRSLRAAVCCAQVPTHGLPVPTCRMLSPKNALLLLLIADESVPLTGGDLFRIHDHFKFILHRQLSCHVSALQDALEYCSKPRMLCCSNQDTQMHHRRHSGTHPVDLSIPIGVYRVEVLKHLFHLVCPHVSGTPHPATYCFGKLRWTAQHGQTPAAYGRHGACSPGLSVTPSRFCSALQSQSLILSTSGSMTRTPHSPQHANREGAEATFAADAPVIIMTP